MAGVPDIFFYISRKIHLFQHRHFQCIGHKRYPHIVQQYRSGFTGKTEEILHPGGILGYIKKLLVSLVFICLAHRYNRFGTPCRTLSAAFFVEVERKSHLGHVA